MASGGKELALLMSGIRAEGVVDPGNPAYLLQDVVQVSGIR